MQEQNNLATGAQKPSFERAFLYLQKNRTPKEYLLQLNTIVINRESDIIVFELDATLERIHYDHMHPLCCYPIILFVGTYDHN